MSALNIQTTSSALTKIKPLPLVKQDALPQGFPATISGNVAWTGKDFANSEAFIYCLSNVEICEICQGLDAFKSECQCSAFAFT